MTKPAALASWSPTQQRAYQQGFSLALLMQNEAGLLNKPTPPLSIRHDPTLVYAFEQGYHTGLQQPKLRRYQGIMPWTKIRQLVFFLMVILAGLLVVVMMAPNHDKTAQALAVMPIPKAQPTIRPGEFAVSGERHDFALLTDQEREILQRLKTGVSEQQATKYSDTTARARLSFELLLDQHGVLENDTCRALFIWPLKWREDIRLIWIFNDKNHYAQNNWQEVFFPPTIGTWQVLLIQDNLPIAHHFFYYGGHTFELLE